MDLRDELISFETAKLAKEKGFDVETDRYFDEEGGMWTFNNWGDGLREGAYWRPTQSLLQKWLREVHGIDLTVMIRFADSYSVVIHKNRNVIKEYTGDTFMTKLLRKRNKTVDSYSTKEIIVDPTPKNVKTGVYEEALEKGLQEALKLIK